MARMRKFEIQVNEFDDFDDMTLHVVELHNLKDGYEKVGLDPPDWLVEKCHEGKVAVEARVKIQKQKRLAQLKIKRAQISTPDEKRKNTDAEIAALEAELT